LDHGKSLLHPAFNNGFSSINNNLNITRKIGNNLNKSDENDYIEFNMTTELTMFLVKTFPLNIKLHFVMFFFIIIFR